ncbi:J domain-containing protein [Candidatus Parcubacteria bacterium]|nr:J domain-containing protein [Candidatus Parcubacteria bacterium]
MEISEIIRQAVYFGFVGAVFLIVDICINDKDAEYWHACGIVACIIVVIVMVKFYCLLYGDEGFKYFTIEHVVVVIMCIATTFMLSCGYDKVKTKSMIPDTIMIAIIITISMFLIVMLSAVSIKLSFFIAYVIFWILILSPKALIQINLIWSSRRNNVNKVESKLTLKSKQRIISKAQKKSLSQLIHRVKEESSQLIPMIDKNIAEIVDAIRKKSHESYNNFMSGKVEFEIVQRILEETISDLLAIKEMTQVNRSDVIIFYDILGIKSNASDKKVSKAYMNLLKLIHPDTAPNGTEKVSNNLTAIINSAYDNFTKKEAV